MTDDVDELREFAETIAVRAGDEALAGRRRLGVGQPVAHDTKSTTTDPVTEYDRAAERLIADEIRRRYPDDAIVGEEGADDSGTSGREWHVDPIDGTVNFVYDLPSWCTSIAVVDATGSIAGAVYAPVTGELYSAGRGRGATLNGSAIACSAVTELERALVATGFSYSADRRARQADRLARLLPSVRDVRRLGSAAIDLCLVACGRLDAYYEEHLNSWDIAAAVLIAAEAGAVTSDFEGGPPRPAATIAAGPGVHRQLVELLAVLDA
ncbi:MAG TPA: inositol monophosphatase family protein [Ilumatobacteraceae bacterium]|nr:inositol monophosphatase family protein [Ilumatobacteraceae bacterium]